MKINKMKNKRIVALNNTDKFELRFHVFQGI